MTFPSTAISTASAPAASSCAVPTSSNSAPAPPSRTGFPRPSKMSATPLPTAFAADIGGRRRRDRRRSGGGRSRRHPGGRQRSAAPHRPLPHHLDFRPAHGAGRRHRHGRAARGFRALSRLRVAPAGQEIRGRAPLSSAIAGYLFLSGGEVAAQRSFIMLAVMLAALLFDRAALTMRNLAISAIVVIAISPHEVVGPSFQMSFAATAALVGAYAIWAERRHATKRAPPVQRRSLMAARYCQGRSARSARLPSRPSSRASRRPLFGVYHFQRVSPLSLLANLAVDADRLASRHAFRRRRLAGNAVRTGRAVLRRDGRRACRR